MLIAFVGFRGVGKTFYAKKLAQIGFGPYYSTDELLLGRFSCSVEEFVKKNTWSAFRREESLVLEELILKDHGIIDTGGGIIEDKKNQLLLKNSAFVIYLQSCFESIFSRLFYSETRAPLFDDTRDSKEELERLFNYREPIYQAVADKVINIQKKSPEEVFKALLDSIHCQAKH